MTVTAPPLQGLEPIPLPFYMRANLVPANRRTRGDMPRWVERRMRNMNRLRGDERGHGGRATYWPPH